LWIDDLDAEAGEFGGELSEPLIIGGTDDKILTSTNWNS
jgi:hypothetical protein